MASRDRRGVLILYLARLKLVEAVCGASATPAGPLTEVARWKAVAARVRSLFPIEYAYRRRSRLRMNAEVFLACRRAVRLTTH